MRARKRIRKIARRGHVTRTLEVATVISILSIAAPRAKGKAAGEGIVAVGGAPVQAQERDLIVPTETYLTVALSAVEPVMPGGLLPVDVEILQQGSAGLSSLSLILRYDPQLMQIKAPVEKAFEVASSGADPVACVFKYEVNQDAGLVALTLSRDADSLLAGKSGRLAKIIFTVDEGVELGEQVHFDFVNVLATDEAGWAIPARGVDLELTDFKSGI